MRNTKSLLKILRIGYSAPWILAMPIRQVPFRLRAASALQLIVQLRPKLQSFASNHSDSPCRNGLPLERRYTPGDQDAKRAPFSLRKPPAMDQSVRSG